MRRGDEVESQKTVDRPLDEVKAITHWPIYNPGFRASTVSSCTRWSQLKRGKTLAKLTLT